MTYALVEEGLKTPVADTAPKDGVVIAREWLNFATERVPQMQEEKMSQGRGVGLEIVFAEGEKRIRATPASLLPERAGSESTGDRKTLDTS